MYMRVYACTTCACIGVSSGCGQTAPAAAAAEVVAPPGPERVLLPLETSASSRRRVQMEMAVGSPAPQQRTGASGKDSRLLDCGGAEPAWREVGGEGW